MFWRLTNQDFNIRLVDVKNEKNNCLLAGVSFPPSSSPRVSLAPKTPFPFPFKRLPRRLSLTLKKIKRDWLTGTFPNGNIKFSATHNFVLRVVLPTRRYDDRDYIRETLIKYWAHNGIRTLWCMHTVYWCNYLEFRVNVFRLVELACFWQLRCSKLVTKKHIIIWWVYCAFHKHANSEVQKPIDSIAFFAAVNHLNGPLRKQNFTLTGSKGHGLWFVIVGFRSVLCVSVFQCSLLVIVIMIDGSEKRNCEGVFWTLEFACLWKAQ